MSLAITLLIIIALCIIGTRIATAIFGILDDDDAPEAMTGDDYPGTASEAAER